MYCGKCGKIIPENIDFCPSCNDINQPVENNNQINTITIICQCGQKLEANWKFCPQCNKHINVKLTNIEETMPIKKENSQIYVIISLFSITLGFILGASGGIFYLVALVTLVAGKINCPNSRAIKVLFWLMLFFIILYVILIMWMIAVCSSTIQSCG